MATLNWFGIQRSAEILAKVKRGIDKTSSDAVKVAKQEVHVDTAYLQGSIRPEPAKIYETQVVGGFGTHMPIPPGAEHAYDYWQEFLPPEKGGKPYMRPAQANAEANLAKNIQDA